MDNTFKYPLKIVNKLIIVKVEEEENAALELLQLVKLLVQFEDITNEYFSRN